MRCPGASLDPKFDKRENDLKFTNRAGAEQMDRKRAKDGDLFYCWPACAWCECVVRMHGTMDFDPEIGP